MNVANTHATRSIKGPQPERVSEKAGRFVVLLCSHNGERFIEEQINSILDQIDPVDLIYVHDFASTDGTRTILDRLAHGAYNRLIITKHSDAPGAAASFVRALQLTAPMLSDGSLVFLSDQDDLWLPDKSQTIKTEITRRHLSSDTPFVLFHDVCVVDDELTILRPTYYTGKPFRIPRDLDASRLLMANPAIGHTMLLSAPLVQELATWPYAEQYFMHDWLAILISSRIGRVEHVPLALSLYRQHSSNILGAYKTRKRIISSSSMHRLLSFVDRMINQAVVFSRAVHGRSNRTPTRADSPWLEIACRRGYRTAAVALSIGALIYGPTWQRKAIGLLLLLRAFLGPIDQTLKKII